MEKRKLTEDLSTDYELYLKSSGDSHHTASLEVLENNVWKMNFSNGYVGQMAATCYNHQIYERECVSL